MNDRVKAVEAMLLAMGGQNLTLEKRLEKEKELLECRREIESRKGGEDWDSVMRLRYR